MNPLYFGMGVAGLFGIYADLAMNIASATNSSPQTTELFAGQRSETLWKWVKIGGVVAIAFGLFGTIISGTVIPLLAVGSVILVMGVMYRYALKWGNGNS
jgi:uncharacterized membrane protein HdeD (DUF308 family)